MSYEFKGNPGNLLSHMLSENENPNHTEHIYSFNELAHQIAQEEIQRIVPELCESICIKAFQSTLNAVMRAFEYDINTVLTLSFGDLESMFRSQKARKFISDAITKEVRKSLNNVHLDFKM